MRNVRLQIPPEVEDVVIDLRHYDDDDVLSTSGAAISGMDTVAACVPESGLRERLPVLVERLRTWVATNAPTRHIELEVQNRETSRVIDLTEDVTASEISSVMSMVFGDDQGTRS